MIFVTDGTPKVYSPELDLNAPRSDGSLNHKQFTYGGGPVMADDVWRFHPIANNLKIYEKRWI